MSSSLISMVVSASVDTIGQYLRLLPAEKLSAELTQSDSQGKMPLHLAIEKADTEMVKLLLSFDAPVNAKLGNKTTEDYAKELITTEPKDKRREVYALIKSRGRWQSSAAKNQGIVFSRSMKMVEETVSKVDKALGKTGVLFLGITGEGKSTFINYLYGTNYKVEKIKGIKKVVPTNPEVAAVGHSTTSATFLPQVIELKDKPYVLVDLPGFEDTRGTAEEICAAAGIGMLTKQLIAVQAIPFVVSWLSLIDSRMVTYRKAAHNVGAMISKDPKTAENVILVVTKPDHDLEEGDVRARLEELAKGEKWDPRSTTPLKREDLDDDAWKNHCLRNATVAILSHTNNIILADVTKGEVRIAFQEIIKGLEKKSKSPNQFEFKSYSRFMKQFQTVVESMIIHYNSLTREKMSEMEMLKNLETRIVETTKEIKDQEDSIAKLEAQKGQPFTEESFNKKIQEEREKLSDLRKKNQGQKTSMQKAELEAKIKSAKLENVEKEGERLFETIHRDWVCEKTEDRNETEVIEKGAINVPGRGMMMEVEIKKTVVPGKEKTVSESINYPSAIPVKRYADRSTGGRFESSNFTPGTTSITGKFISTPGMHGGVACNIDLYADVKDLPETKDKLNKLQQELKNAESEFESAKQDLISEDDIEASSERLKAIELEKISAIGDHKRTKEICEMQIQVLETELKKTQAKLAELSPQEDKHKVELEDLKLQLQVNEDLFAKLKKIIQVMEFKGEVIEQFLAL